MVHVCALGFGPHNCEADWVGGVHAFTLGTGAENFESHWVHGVHLCPLSVRSVHQGLQLDIPVQTGSNLTHFRP